MVIELAGNFKAADPLEEPWYSSAIVTLADATDQEISMRLICLCVAVCLGL